MPTAIQVDPEMLMEKLISESEELTKLINLRFYMQAGSTKLVKVQLLTTTIAFLRLVFIINI